MFESLARHISSRVPKNKTAPQHVSGHETVPSTSPGTQPGPIVPRAVLQHVGGYETQGKRSPPRAK